MIAPIKRIAQVLSPERFEAILAKFSHNAPILILGDVGIDRYTIGEVSRISPEAPVPVLNVSRNWNKLGLAANISDNLKTLKVTSTLCSVVGKDQHASVLEALLEDIGQSTWGLIYDDKRPTTLKERITTSGQQICRVDYEQTHPISADIESKLLSRLQEFLPKHGAVIIEDYDKGVLTPNVLARAISSAKEKNILIAVDPGRNRPANLYRGANLLKPNLTEAKQLAQSLGIRSQDPRELCQVLLDKLELDMVALTLGPEGMALMDRQSGERGLRIIPTLATEVFDVSGAGDTVIAILVSTLLAGGNLEEAAWLANCAAGVVVSKKGTATVDQDELREFYQRLKSKLDH